MRVLERIAPYMREQGLLLGGGTALALRYHHRESRDIDLFTWTGDRDTVLSDLFRILTGFNRIIEGPVLFVEDPETHETVKIEVHVRDPDRVRLLGESDIEGIPALSDEDILAEKIFYGSRCFDRDLFDVKFLLGKGYGERLDEILRRKFGVELREVLEDLRGACPPLYRLLLPFAKNPP